MIDRVALFVLALQRTGWPAFQDHRDPLALPVFPETCLWCRVRAWGFIGRCCVEWFGTWLRDVGPVAAILGRAGPARKLIQVNGELSYFLIKKIIILNRFHELCTFKGL